MSERKVLIVRPEDQRKVIFGAGDQYCFFATGDDTDGQYFFFEGIIPPGGGPPPHIQTREEEAFYILEGEVTFYTDEGEFLAGAGTYLNAPKAAKHSFRNNAEDTARMLIFFAPAGIEKLFDEFPALEQGDSSPSLDQFNAIGSKYGVQYFEPEAIE